MDENLDASASKTVITNHSHTVQRKTPSSTAPMQKVKESHVVDTDEPGQVEEPKPDGLFQDKPVSMVVLASPDALEAILAASLPCPQSPTSADALEAMLAASVPCPQSPSCTEGSCETDENDSISALPQQLMLSFEPDMRDPMRPRPTVVDEHTKTSFDEGSKSQKMGDTQNERNILTDECCELNLLKRSHHAAWFKSGVHKTVIFHELRNSRLWSPKDSSIVEGKPIVNNDNNKRQNSEVPSAEANALRVVIVRLPSIVPPIFRTGIKISYNTELKEVASPVVESSSVANTEPLSAGIVDSRFLAVENVDVPFAAATHCEESCTCTTANMKNQISESRDVKESAVAPQSLQTNGTNGVELQIDESLDSAYPAAAPLDSKSCSITAASLKSHTVELHDLADVAAAPQVALDDVSSSNEKFEKDSTADQAVEPNPREQVLVSEEVLKADSETSPNSDTGDTPGNPDIGTISKDETAAASPVPQLTRKQELKKAQYRKFIGQKKERRYARKIEAQHAALDISNKTPAPQTHQQSTTKGPTTEDGDTSSNDGNVPPLSRANSEPFEVRPRRFQEVRQILHQNIDTAQSNVRPHASDDADCKAVEASRHDGFNEVEGVMNRTKGPDDITNVPPQVDMMKDTRDTNARCRPVQRMSDVWTENNHHDREKRGEQPHVRPQSPCDQGIAQDYEDANTHTPSPMKIEVQSGATGGVEQASDDIDDDMQPRGVLPVSEWCVDVDMRKLEEEVVPLPTKRKWKKVRRVVAGAIDVSKRVQGIPGWQGLQGWPEESYAKPSAHPHLPPDSSISSRKHQPLNLHVQHDQHSMNDSEPDTFSSFTLIDRQPPLPPEDMMSVDGFGRTARGPRGRHPRRGSLNLYLNQNQNQNQNQSQNQNQNQNQNHCLSVHDQPVNVCNEFKVETMSTARRQHPGYQPQSRQSDQYRPLNGPTSNGRTSRNQSFPPNATSLDKSSGTVTNHSDPVMTSNCAAATNPNMMMATINPKPTRQDMEHTNTNTTRVQTSTHDTKRSQNNSTPLAHTNMHAPGDLSAQTPVKGEGGMNSHDQSRQSAMSPTRNTTDSGHTGITITANNFNTNGFNANGFNASEMVTPNHLNQSNYRGRDTDRNRDRNRDRDRDRETDRDSGVPLPPPTNNTNNSNYGRFREPGSGTGSVRTGKLKRRIATSSAAPTYQEVPSIVPDGNWDASGNWDSSTIPSNANAFNPSSSMGYRIDLKRVPKYKFANVSLQSAQIHEVLDRQNINNAQAAANNAFRGSHPHATATYPPPRAQQAPAPKVSIPHAPAQPAPAQPAPTQPAPAPAQPTSTQPAPPSAQPAPVQHVPAQSAPAQQAPIPEASVVPSASPDGPEKVQRPKALVKNNGNEIWLAPHLRTPMPAIPIQPSRKAILSPKPRPAEATRKTRASANGHSPEANANTCAIANASSPKANPLQTGATASVPVKVDVSTAGANSRAKHPSARSNADLTTTKDKAAGAKPRSLSNADVSPAKEKAKGATPIALSNADINTGKDKTSAANPSAILNINEESAKGEPLESKPSGAVEVPVSSMRLRSLEPNSTGLLQPDVSTLLPQIPQLSKDKQPELAAPESIGTPRVSLSNVSVNSQTSFIGRRALKKETLDFEHPLAGWDGGWGPAPVEWVGRPSFDHRDSWHVKSMHDWLKERAREALHNPLMLNTKDPGFLTGEAPAAGDIGFGSPIDKAIHHTELPDDEFTKVKRDETADDAVKKHQSKIRVEKQAKQETKAERRAYRHMMREAAANYVPPPNPHEPRANIYIRPAEGRDLKQIAEIYNHYIEHSVAVAERNPLTEHQWRGRWTDATESNYAFLVAVQVSSKGGGHNRRANADIICGFAYADDFGDIGNAWRYTCELQCYVGNWNLRMGVGKSLIDRMMGALDPRYVIRAGARFEGGATPIRYEGGGVRVVHKVVINIPYSSKDEDTFKWQKEWLAQFQFEHVGTLPGIGRKFDKVVNLAMLMMETGSVLPGGRL